MKEERHEGNCVMEGAGRRDSQRNSNHKQGMGRTTAMAIQERQNKGQDQDERQITQTPTGIRWG